MQCIERRNGDLKRFFQVEILGRVYQNVSRAKVRLVSYCATLNKLLYLSVSLGPWV